MQHLQKVGKEVARAVGPIILAVVLLHFTVLPMETQDFWRFLVGALFIYIGMVLFLVGVDFSLVPIGERIGAVLPPKGLWLLLVFALMIGTFATIADPDAQVLAQYVNNASEGAIPSSILMMSVALGMGIFTAVSVLRVVFEVPVAYVLAGGYLATFVLSQFVPPEFISIAFDAGGVATGPLIVPFVLAFGVGVASVLSTKDRMASSFGLVSTAALGPILGVLILGLVYG